MAAHVLVAYATKKGSTEEVARVVAAVLERAGCGVSVAAAGDVRDLAGVDAVVLGGALYTGRWHRDAVRFLKRHATALASVPLAVFAMGPKTLEDADVASSRSQLDRALAGVPDVRPAAVAIFGGVLDPAQHHFPFSRMPASDARDWDAIEAWAGEVARLAQAVPAA